MDEMDEMGEKNRIPEIIQETSSSHRPLVSPLFEENQGIHLAFTKVGTTFTPMRAAAWVCPRPFEPWSAAARALLRLMLALEMVGKYMGMNG